MLENVVTANDAKMLESDCQYKFNVIIIKGDNHWECWKQWNCAHECQIECDESCASHCTVNKLTATSRGGKLSLLNQIYDLQCHMTLDGP